MENLIESLICLLQKLNITDKNASKCKELVRKYRPLLVTTNEQKQQEACKHIKDSFLKIYNEHKSDIIDKDFTFLQENTFIFDNVDMGTLYLNVVDMDDTDKLEAVSNELLFIFYQISPDEDRKMIDEKHRKKKEKEKAKGELESENVTERSKKKNKTKDTPQPNNTPNIAKKMETILSKHKHKLKKAEKDPNAIPEVLADFFKENSGDMAGMLTDMLKGMGLDPSKMQ